MKRLEVGQLVQLSRGVFQDLRRVDVAGEFGGDRHDVRRILRVLGLVVDDGAVKANRGAVPAFFQSGGNGKLIFRRARFPGLNRTSAIFVVDDVLGQRGSAGIRSSDPTVGVTCVVIVDATSVLGAPGHHDAQRKRCSPMPLS